MALNFFDMYASLRMGVDIAPITDPESVPHTTIPGYIPRYTLEILVDEEWKYSREGDIVELTDEAHLTFDGARVLEDGYPIFEAY